MNLKLASPTGVSSLPYGKDLVRQLKPQGPPPEKLAVSNMMTIDVEEWFHVTNFEPYITRGEWVQCESRIEYGLTRMLDLFKTYNAKATFFCLGWVAERVPALIKRIAREGHELASHGQNHKTVTYQTPEEFRRQLVDSKQIIERISGERVDGFRAPSYSIGQRTDWAVQILLESGYRYDSSAFPFGFRREPGWCDTRFPRMFYAHGLGELAEYPLSTYPLLGQNLPIAGGGYFRLFPYWLIKKCISKLNEQGHPAIMYLHPWELDPKQPRVTQANWLVKFRHYHGLEKAFHKLERLLQDFDFYSIRDVYWSRERNAYAIKPQR